MDYKKSNIPHNTISRDMVRMSEDTGNVYETVMIVAKRANQISQEIKQELETKLQEFATISEDLLQEVQENREQTEVSRYYERLPKPTLIAAKEYEDGELYHNVAGRIKK